MEILFKSPLVFCLRIYATWRQYSRFRSGTYNCYRYTSLVYYYGYANELPGIN